MSRTARLTNALRDRRNAVALAGAVAALAGAGSATAALVAPASHASAANHGANVRPSTRRGEHLTAAVHADPQKAATGSKAPAHADAVRPEAARKGAAPARPEHARTVAAHHAAPAVHHSAPAPTKPYTIVDSVTPSALPAGHVDATYATGGYAVSPSAVQGKNVLWIDTNGSDPKASALDVEPGDASPAQAATWASEHLKANPGSPAIIYTMRSEWPAAQAAVAGLPQWMQHQVRWWIADPTGVPHIVPGANATQWYWGKNIDLTLAAPNFR